MRLPRNEEGEAGKGEMEDLRQISFVLLPLRLLPFNPYLLEPKNMWTCIIFERIAAIENEGTEADNPRVVEH